VIKAILFDIDGVLVNGKRFSSLLAHDYHITSEKTVAFFTGPFQECLIGNADLREIIPPYLAEWGWKKSVDDFIWYWFTAEQNIDREIFAYIEVLKSQGIHVYVATNQEKYRSDHLWTELGFSKVFAEMFSSAHIGHFKHEVKFFEKVMKRLPEGINKQNVLLVDDTKENITIAKTFGLKAELYTDFKSFKKYMEMYLK
jgi:putative hydrolase of the HAD superfamily